MTRLRLVLVLFLFGAGFVGAEENRPNLLLILADDLGYSDLGCYGGEIETPYLDALAAGGLRMTQLYNTARCCSTRASLLTGLYPHQAGVGAMTADNGLPGYRGFLTERCVSMASLLAEAGYRTYLSGKWHLRGKGNPECIPTNHGFDRFYGHFRAYASFWRQDLYGHLPAGEETNRNDDKFYATDAITDQGLRFLEEAREEEAPWFLYLAYNAPHFPLHAPKELIDKYVQRYEQGWDAVREERYARMVEIGILRDHEVLSPRGHVTKVPERNRDSPWYDETIPKWETLPEARRKDLARRMATYAAMVEIVDRNIGRVVADLENHGELENTLLVFLSDNGACAEWDPIGFDNNPYPKNLLYEGNDLAKIGQPGTFHSYGTGWANACNTPFRLYKHYNHEGGISSPAILLWPDGIEGNGRIDRSPAHVVDLTATFLELARATYPESRGGSTIIPLQGESLLPVFRGGEMPKRALFFEHEGNRAVRVGRWKLVWTNYAKQWELYDIEQDRSEMNDLAPERPGMVKEMALLWENWAEESFVEKQKVPQPAKGMPKIYYLEE